MPALSDADAAALSLQIVTFTPHKYQTVLNFLHQNYSRTHYHLDWRPVQVWLKDNDTLTLLAYENKELLGVMSFSAPYGQTLWIRLIVLHDNAPLSVFHTLLAEARHRTRVHITQFAVLEFETWVQSLVSEGGFELLERIVHFRRTTLPDTFEKAAWFEIYPVRRDDLGVIEEIDHSAFAPIWQMKRADLQAVLQYAVEFSFAVVNGYCMAYILATEYTDNIHLARLATLPQWQGYGVATTLVKHLISRFPDREMTVNTQASNLASQRVYERLGFQKEAFSTAIWRLRLGS